MLNLPFYFRSQNAFYQQCPLLTLSIILICLLLLSQSLLAEQSKQNIVEVDMPINLFLALSLYHELSEQAPQTLDIPAEENVRHLSSVNQELLSTIEDIIHELWSEQQKVMALLNNENSDIDIQLLEKNQKRLEELQQQFKKELQFRQTMQQLYELMKKQQRLLQGE